MHWQGPVSEESLLTNKKGKDWVLLPCFIAGGEGSSRPSLLLTYLPSNSSPPSKTGVRWYVKIGSKKTVAPILAREWSCENHYQVEGGWMVLIRPPSSIHQLILLSIQLHTCSRITNSKATVFGSSGECFCTRSSMRWWDCRRQWGGEGTGQSESTYLFEMSYLHSWRDISDNRLDARILWIECYAVCIDDMINHARRIVSHAICLPTYKT